MIVCLQPSQAVLKVLSVGFQSGLMWQWSEGVKFLEGKNLVSSARQHWFCDRRAEECELFQRRDATTFVFKSVVERSSEKAQHKVVHKLLATPEAANNCKKIRKLAYIHFLCTKINLCQVWSLNSIPFCWLSQSRISVKSALIANMQLRLASIVFDGVLGAHTAWHSTWQCPLGVVQIVRTHQRERGVLKSLKGCAVVFDGFLGPLRLVVSLFLSNSISTAQGELMALDGRRVSSTALQGSKGRQGN